MTIERGKGADTLIQRILAATDGSDAAARALEWAGEMANKYAAELVVLRVLAPEHLVAAGSEDAPEAQLAAAASRLAPGRGRARVEYSSEPAETIVEVAEEERADLVVVDNFGMSGRTEFLLGSVPNRVSHNAPCTVVIVGADREADRARRREAPTDGEATAGRLLGRAARIAGVVAKYGLGGMFDRDGDQRDTDVARARRLRKALEELGPTFAKLGQILSTRHDLLPAAFIEELSALQDQVTPLTEADVVAVMEQELRVPWEDVFKSIEPQPMAAGTIAQVHRAVLVDGGRVVIKVQRPDAGPQILRDLGLLEEFAEKAAQRPAFQQVVDIPAIIEHLSSSLRRELDFRHEAENIERMRTVLAPFDRLDVPRVYGDLSTARLLVMEEVQGIPVGRAPEGEARRAAGRQMLEAYYQQVLADGFFHADPHPGNLMWWHDKIYVLDLGMVGEVDAELRRSLLLLLLAFWQEDTAFLADVMLSLTQERPPPAFDHAAYRDALASLVATYRHLPLNELRLGPLIQQLTEISVRHGVRLPASLALIGKAFGQMQLAAAELDPTLDPFSVASRFYMRQLAGQLRSSANPRKMFYETQKLRVRLEALVEGFERIAGTRSGEGLRVDFGGHEALRDSISLGGRRVGVGLAAAASIVATAVVATARNAPVWATPTFGAASAILSGGLAVDALRRR